MVASTKKQSVKYDSITDAGVSLPGTPDNKYNDDFTQNHQAVYADAGQAEEKRPEGIDGHTINGTPSERGKYVEPVKAGAKIVDNIIMEEQKTEGKPGEDISLIPGVSLYEDSSGIIDYENNNSIIDPGLKEYKKIKRIGEGTLELLNDGINFRTGKKLFRFDYHRVNEVKKGKNYFVLLMKGSNINRIFVFKNNAVLNGKLNQFSQTG